MVETKGKSPFYPGQPVPVELFVGRASQIDRIVTRGVGQVSKGKTVAVYVQGEYGIGKSSLAGYVQEIAEREQGLHGIYASLAAAKNLEDITAAVLEATIRSGAFDPRRSEKIRNWLADYIEKLEVLGFTLNMDSLKRHPPNLSSHMGMLSFLTEAMLRLKEEGVKGIFFILDEINGIADNPQFAHFIKGLIDTNAMSREPLPILLMLCGVEERRRKMISNHQPIDRIFDVVEIEPMNEMEMNQFFTHSFESVGIKIAPDAMKTLVHFSAGFPKIMHLIGDAAFWRDKDGIINKEEALDAVIDAAEQVGKKYVDQQIYKALRSADYHSILDKVVQVAPPFSSARFKKSEVSAALNEKEKKAFSNFLTKMKKLKVLRQGDEQGEYVFNVRMVHLYIWMRSEYDKMEGRHLKM